MDNISVDSRTVDLSATFGGLGPRLRAARLERGLSQEALARPFFTKSYVSAVERNKVRPSLKALELIARKLEIPIQELLAVPANTEGEIDLDAVEQDIAYQLDHVKYLHDSYKAHDALQLINSVETESGEHFPELSNNIQYRFYFLRASSYQRLGEPATARQDLNEALRFAQLIEGGDEEVARARNLIGGTYYDQDMPRRALEHHELAMQAVTAGKVKNLNLKLSIQTNLASDYWALGDLNQAIGVYKESLETAKDTNNLERQAAVYWGLSMSYQAANDLDRAKLYGAQALTILEVSQNFNAATKMRVNLAAISISRGELDEADELLQQAAEGVNERGDALSRSTLNDYRASLELKRGHIDKAEEYAREGAQLSSAAYAQGADLDAQAQAHAARTYARSLRTSALIEEARGNRDNADSLLDQALSILAGTGYAETVSDIEFDYAELLAARGNHQEAALHYRAAYQQRRRGG